MSAPVITGEIVGFRQWRVTPDLELRAAAHVHRRTWSLGHNKAECRRRLVDVLPTIMGNPEVLSPCGDTPGENCECGFYALHSPNDLWYGEGAKGMASFFSYTFGGEDPDTLVSGVIVGWGKVQVHHQGFRSEFARVAAIGLPKSKRDQVVARAVAAAYDVPCVSRGSLAKIGDEFGSTVPEGLRPEAPPRRDELLYSGGWTFPAGLFHQQLGGVVTFPATGALKAALKSIEDFGLEKAKPGDGKVSEAISRRPSANRQGPPRPKRAPKRLGP